MAGGDGAGGAPGSAGAGGAGRCGRPRVPQLRGAVVAAAGSPARVVSTLSPLPSPPPSPLPNSAEGSGEPGGAGNNGAGLGSAGGRALLPFPGKGGGGAGAALACRACAAACLARPLAPAGLDFRASRAGRELRRLPTPVRGRRKGGGESPALGSGLGRRGWGWEEAASPQDTAEKGQAAFVCGLLLLLFFQGLCVPGKERKRIPVSRSVSLNEQGGGYKARAPLFPRSVGGTDGRQPYHPPPPPPPPGCRSFVCGA